MTPNNALITTRSTISRPAAKRKGNVKSKSTHRRTLTYDSGPRVRACPFSRGISDKGKRQKHRVESRFRCLTEVVTKDSGNRIAHVVAEQPITEEPEEGIDQGDLGRGPGMPSLHGLLKGDVLAGHPRPQEVRIAYDGLHDPGHASGRSSSTQAR